MKIYKNFNISKKFKNSAIAIGNFDGFHLGHQKVINKGKYIAKKNKLKFGLLVFHPLPVMFFSKKLKNYRIDSLKQKIESSKKFGVDFLIIKKFDKNFSKISAENFIEAVLYRKLMVKLIFISKNFKFGKNRTGDIKLLKKKQNYLNYKTKTIAPLNKKNKIISSTLIRKNIKKGRIDFANKMLGRYWTIEGKVKRGEKRGRRIGFPTCNLDLGNYIIPKIGVYSSIVNVNNKFKKKAIVNIGYKPTFGKNKLLLEAHIFGLKKNLYDKSIKIMLIKFIRKEKKFKNIIQLKKQIKKDINRAKG
jgi:riboflavin kinase/FMN adenylyltransferase